MLAGLDDGRVQTWVDAGLFDRVKDSNGDWVAQALVLAQLDRAGVPMEILKAAHAEDVLARAYIFEMLQADRQGQHLFRHVAERTGMEEQMLLRFCDALGVDDSSVFSDGEMAFLEALGDSLREGLPAAMALELCEIWGSQMRFIAHAEVISYDTNVARRIGVAAGGRGDDGVPDAGDAPRRGPRPPAAAPATPSPGDQPGARGRP